MVTVRIEDYCDGFAIVVITNNTKEKRFAFDQEDNRKALKDMFEYIGIEAKYEEVY